MVKTVSGRLYSEAESRAYARARAGRAFPGNLPHTCANDEASRSQVCSHRGGGRDKTSTLQPQQLQRCPQPARRVRSDWPQRTQTAAIDCTLSVSRRRARQSQPEGRNAAMTLYAEQTRYAYPQSKGHPTGYFAKKTRLLLHSLRANVLCRTGHSDL